MERQALRHDRVFDDPEWARTYARREGGAGARRGRRYARELKALGFRGGRILDAGCGPGTTALALARALPDADVIGIDLSEPLLRLARAHAEAEGVTERVRFTHADVHDIPWPLDAFEAVICIGMLHIVEDPITMLGEFERVLRPSGQLLMHDIRRSWFGLVEPVFRSAWTLPEGREVILRSSLRPVLFRESFLWWGASAPLSGRLTSS